MAADPQAHIRALKLQLQTLQAEYQTLRLQKESSFQRVFYRIAERATAGLPLYDFLKEVHTLLNELLPSKNLYVSLYDPSTNTLNFPYYVDERDGDRLQRGNVPIKRGLTEFVLRTGIPQLISAERFSKLQAQGEITEASGDLTFSTWLGVPLVMHGAINGALVVQSYMQGDSYSTEQADALAFVANHLSNAIERYRAIEELRHSEHRYRSVVDNISVGLVVVQNARVVFVNPSMSRIVGHTTEYLLSHTIYDIVYPADLSALVEYETRRSRGASVEPLHNFRILTAGGEIRHLESSAVSIQWDKKNAMLAFAADITDRISAEQAHLAAVQQQTVLNEMKARFIAVTSHEFRTPLASIQGSVDLLLHYEDRMSPEKKHQALQNIDDAAERMTHMLGNVMQIGRADAGELQFRPKPLALTPFCLALVDELRSSMPRQFEQIQLTLELCPPEQRYLLDEALIRNIVGNLLSNAIKYSPRGGVVTLSAHESDGAMVLCVTDQGIGIPDEDKAFLFKSFFRANNVGAIAGTGLGLSIVKEAVNCHRGTINVLSEIGKGSRFTVMLPTSIQ